MAGKPKILVVEDDPIVALDIKHKLRDFGYEICGSAATGEDAIAKAAEKLPDAVLMDITLEGKMDGIEAADSIRKKLSIPVVYLTAHSDQSTLDRAKLTMPFGYVLKPIREIELKIALEMALYAGSKKPAEDSKQSQRTASTESPPGKLNSGERSYICSELLKFSPFTKLSANLLEQIADQCSIKEYGALEVVSMEGNSDATDGFLVLDGRIAMLKTSLNGRELAVQLVGPNSTFGLLSCLDSESLELTIRAQIETKLLHVPKAGMLYLLGAAPSLYPDFLAEYSRRMHALHNMARSLAHDKVDVRVAAMLAALIEKEDGMAAGSGGAEIKMSRQELANLAGTTVETAIRVTRALENSGVLELPDHRVIRVLNPDKLRMLAQGNEE